MKQLIEDLISAMEYHVEQTRPIHTTTVALQAAREALKSLPQEQGEPVIDKSAAIRIATALGWTPPNQKQGKPKAWMSQNGKSVVTDGDKHHYPAYLTRYSIPLYTKQQPKHEPVAKHYVDGGHVVYPAKRTFIGLTDDEILQGNKESWVTLQAWQSAVWWAEEKLRSKNT
jgi:hypothetical protein